MNTQNKKEELNCLNNNLPGRRENAQKIKKMAVVAILTAVASVLMMLEISLPFMPTFLKYDLSEIPVLIGAFAFGPLYAILIELLKNTILLTKTSTAGIGQLANFFAGVLFAGTAGFVYQYMKSRKGALISMLVGTLVLTVGTPLLNYYVFLPLYSTVLSFPTEAVVGMTAAVNPLVSDKRTLVLFAFGPFNLFKGLSISLITFLIYKPISRLINYWICQNKSEKKSVSKRVNTDTKVQAKPQDADNT